MKQLTSISLFLLLLLGCGQAEMGEKMATEAASTDDVGDQQYSPQEPYAPDPSGEGLAALEARAEQKVADLLSYIELLANAEMDAEFRAQAEQMMLDLFDSEDTDVSGLPRCSALNSLLVSDLQAAISAGNMQSIKLGAITDNKLSQVSQDAFEGSFTAAITASCKSESITANCRINYQIELIEKDFGGEKAFVWEVTLGTIEPS